LRHGYCYLIPLCGVSLKCCECIWQKMGQNLRHKKSYLVFEIAVGNLPLIELAWVKRPAPSLRSNIPQTALVAALDTCCSTGATRWQIRRRETMPKIFAQHTSMHAEGRSSWPSTQLDHWRDLAQKNRYCF
jgi:hypothetical protein